MLFLRIVIYKQFHSDDVVPMKVVKKPLKRSLTIAHLLTYLVREQYLHERKVAILVRSLYLHEEFVSFKEHIQVEGITDAVSLKKRRQTPPFECLYIKAIRRARVNDYVVRWLPELEARC